MAAVLTCLGTLAVKHTHYKLNKLAMEKEPEEAMETDLDEVVEKGPCEAKETESSGTKETELSEAKETEPSEAKEIEPDEVVEKEPDEIVEKKPDKVVEKKPDEVVEKEPDEVMEKEPDEVMEKKPDEVMEKKPGEVMEEEPGEVMEKEPEEVMEKEPGEAAETTPCDVKEKELDKVLDKNPDVAVEKEPDDLLNIAPPEPDAPKQEVATDAELIRDSQADLAKVDVLVCGVCHEVYHFVEEFAEHKSSGKCSGVPSVKCEKEGKQQVWGFTLWKNKQLKILKDTGKDIPGSWEVYQKWVKIGQEEKDLWIAAGRTLQFCHKIASAKVQELTGKGKKVEKDPLALDANSDGSDDSKKGVRTPAKSDKEEYNVEKIVGKRFNPKTRHWEYEVKWENYDTETWEPLAHLENCKAMVQEYEAKLKQEKEEQKEKRGRGRPRTGLTPLSTPVKIIQKKTSVVTPVIFSSPGGRPQRTSKQKALNQVKAWCGNISDTDEPLKRSFDSDSESSGSPIKRMKMGKKESESEDYTDEETVVPVKSVTKVVHTYNNGVGKKLPDNVLVPDSKGVVRISQKQLPSLSSGVYIMSRSSGIIKLDSTASKIATSGGQAIVKVGPKVGQTQIKVIKKPDSTTASSAKDSASSKAIKTVAQVVSKASKKEAEKGRKIDVAQLASPSFKEISKVPPKIFDDDSDDGIEELEFPKDLPLPVPESPPGEFVLDPFTGKIAGEEYPDPGPLKTNIVKQETIDNIVKLAAADITEEDLKPDTNTVTITANEPVVVTTNENTVSSSSSSTPIKTTPVKADQSILNTAMVNSNILQKTLLTPVSRKSQPKVLNQSVGAKPLTQAVVKPLTQAKARPITQVGVRPLAQAGARPPTQIGARPSTQAGVKSLTQAGARLSTQAGARLSTQAGTRISMQAGARLSTQAGVKPLTQVVRTPVMKVGLARSKPNILPKKYNVAATTTPNIKTVYSRVKSGVPAKIGHTTIQYRTTSAKSYPSASQARNQSARLTPIKKNSPKVLNASVSHAAITPKAIISMPSLTTDDGSATATLLSTSAVSVANSSTNDANLSTFTLGDGDRPMFITGDDGTIYQVAGQNEEGQTILLTQGSDGQQQCLLVTNEAVQETTQQIETPAQVMMEVQEQPAEVAEDQPVVAQFIRTEPPSPGGTHKVVVMLPDGSIMVTQVSPEEYASLELDK